MRDESLAAVVGAFVATRRAAQVAAGREGPLVVGLNGPQGCGKSTLAAALVAALRGTDTRAAAVSIDDFYLTRAAQAALAAAHPGNRFLEHRGYPGTHDVALGTAVVEALCDPAPGEVAVPVYDKSAHAGRGDRAPRVRWPRVVTPLDVLFVEGWMLGFRPVPAEALSELEPDLAAPNTALAAYAAWEANLGAFVELVAPSPAQIVAWRVDAERARRARGEPALTEAEARDYISRFLPAYALWGREMHERPDEPGEVLRVFLNADRSARAEGQRGP